MTKTSVARAERGHLFGVLVLPSTDALNELTSTKRPKKGVGKVAGVSWGLRSSIPPETRPVIIPRAAGNRRQSSVSRAR